jgi:hypothetical protein
MIYTKRLPKLDLPEALYLEVLKVIRDQELIFTPTSFEYNRKVGTTWFESILAKLGFGKKGRLAMHILPDDIRDKIIQHYKPLIDRVGQPYKIRIKSTMNSRFVFPHSDKFRFGGNVPTGDSCSVAIGIITNGETTCFYEWPKGFQYSFWHYLKLKRMAEIQSAPRQAYMYNNNALHAVFGCDPKLHRHILAISWQTVDIEDLNQAILDVYGE